MKKHDDFLKLVKKKIKESDKYNIIKLMGYHNLSKGLERTEKLLSIESLDDWFKKSGYDLKYTNKAFLLKLIEVLDLDINYFNAICTELTEKLNKIDLMEQPYIFVNTKFKRKSEPIFVLAMMEHSRRIPVDKVIVIESDDDGLSMVQKTVKEHFKEHRGKLGCWGNIDNYVYHVNGKNIIIKKSGKIEHNDNEIPVENQAIVWLGNKKMF